MTKQRVVAIVGPTGSGKARLAVEVARAVGADLVSCDSMKVYRGLDVGTAKPTPKQREGVRWHGLDLVEPWESFDAKRFGDLVDTVRADARAAGRPVLLSGGTMLYLKSATEGLSDAPPRDPALRERLRAEAGLHGSPALHQRLRSVDSQAAARIHPNDVRRIVRALEVHTLSGRPLSSFHVGSPARDALERVVFVVTRERPDMDSRIHARVDRMLANGWIDECRALRADSRGISKEAGQAIGYRQILDWLDGEESEPLEEIATRIKTATRRFARRQLTWIRQLKECRTLHTEPEGSSLAHVERVVETLL